MGRWKFATVLFAATVIATILSFWAASNVWLYLLPRTAFLNAAYFFAASSFCMFFVMLFLDDISEWLQKLQAGFLKSVSHFFFSIVYMGAILLALFFITVAVKNLWDLRVCGFDQIQENCTKKQQELTEEELEKLKKSISEYTNLEDLF